MLADDLGMDTIDLGGAIGLILECQQRCIVSKEEADGRKLEFGNADDVEFLMHLIANRRGLGDLAAEGAYRAAKKLNAGQYAFCMKKAYAGLHAKSHLAWSLSYLTSSRGPDHLKGYVFTSFGGFFWEIVSKHIFGSDAGKTFALPMNKGRVVWWHENYKTIIDALGLCIFALQALPCSGNALFRDFAHIMNALYNFELTDEDVFYAAERIYQMQNAFNVNCGLSLHDYQWPQRRKEANVDERVIEKTIIDVRDHSGMLPEYFAYRGLTDEGKPSVERFLELGLLEYMEKAKAVDFIDVKTCKELLQTVGLDVKLTTGERIKYFVISSLLCRLMEFKVKGDKRKYLQRKKQQIKAGTGR
jgi:aldehyde:ferredoxin oxidoreductase